MCLPCDGADEADTRFLPRVLKSIAEQTCLPGKVILAVSGISEKQSAELLAGLPDYKERFPLQVLAKSEKLSAGPNRNRCALAADTEVWAENEGYEYQSYDIPYPYSGSFSAVSNPNFAFVS